VQHTLFGATVHELVKPVETAYMLRLLMFPSSGFSQSWIVLRSRLTPSASSWVYFSFVTSMTLRQTWQERLDVSPFGDL